MFDQHHMTGAALDLTIDAVWNWSVSDAKNSMAGGRRHRDGQCPGETCYALPHGGTYHTSMAMSYYFSARSRTLPFRRAFEERTRQERDVAELTVKNGAAKFLEPACASDTCPDCDRPFWWHIWIANQTILCPFGREFWTYARALHATRHAGFPGVARDVMREIARDTRQEGPQNLAAVLG